MNVERIGYWDNFYSGKQLSTPLYPSQFAAFAIGEAADATRVIEFGCGNGRDSEFFASYGLDVTAFDASESAIEFCNKRNHYRNLRFKKFALGDDMASIVDPHPTTGKALLYARFFLHAITDEEEAIFLSIANELVEGGSVVAFEYRCSEDEHGKKEFGQHFRRYLKHSELCDRVAKSGFDISYQIEGKGFAKYKAEDAVVGRCIAIKKAG